MNAKPADSALLYRQIEIRARPFEQVEPDPIVVDLDRQDVTLEPEAHVNGVLVIVLAPVPDDIADHLVEDELFPDVALVGLYGNTLMGIAPQRPRQPDDDQPCVFQSFRPSCQIKLVDYEDHTKLVDYGDRGRVKFTLLSRDMFVPNCVERDTAIRVRPTIGFQGDGVAQIEPLPGASADVIVGVY